MTSASLNSRTAKDLAEMARKRGVNGWHSMRKEQLIRALLRAAKAKSNKSRIGAGKPAKVAAPSRRAINGKGKPFVKPAPKGLKTTGLKPAAHSTGMKPAAHSTAIKVAPRPKRDAAALERI